MSPILLNLHTCYVSRADEQIPAFAHRIRYPVDNFNTLESLLLGDALISSDQNAILPSPGLVLCLIEHTEGLGDVLGREFPRFPKSILKCIQSGKAFAPGSSLAPQWLENLRFSFLENYLRIEHESPDLEIEQPGYHLGPCKIRSMPLAVWTGGHLESRRTSIPLVMVIGDWDQSNIMQLIHHCKGKIGDVTRLHRLMECPEWIYHDLFSTFMDWNGIWDAVRDELGKLDHEVHHHFGTGNILGRIQGLNKATATNIMLREALNVQKNSLKTVMKLGGINPSPDRTIPDTVFAKRAQELANALEHYWALANGNREQLQNLVSMMVSLEQISQGQSVGRLNVLAFTFLPLSFVASIFGMTQFTITPRWYPVYALPMLAITCIVAIFLPKVISAWEKWQKFEIPKLRRRLKRSNSQDGAQKNASNASLREKSYPPITMSRYKGKWSEDRGRQLEKAASDASLKHHARQSSLPSSLKSRRGGEPLSLGTLGW